MRVCIFCGARADSKEHLFPAWLDRDFVQPKGTAMPVTHRIDDVETFRQNWKIAHIEVRCVCGRCNSGWMSSLERRVKPLIVDFMKGQAMSLNPHQQLDLSTWATLKAFVYEAAANHPPIVTQGERDLLMRHQQTPANVRVFLAAMDEGNHFIVQRKFFAGLRTKESSALEYAYSTTFVVGHLVAQVVGSPTSPHHAFKQEAIVRPRWQTITPPVLPSATWPGQELLSEKTLEEFANEFVPDVEERLDPHSYPPDAAQP